MEKYDTNANVFVLGNARANVFVSLAIRIVYDCA
jgi:hypothetical protein